MPVDHTLPDTSVRHSSEMNKQNTLLEGAHKHLELAPEIQNGLRWKKASSRRVKAGDPAGNLSGNGYYELKLLGIRTTNHRLIFLMINGYLPEYVDHKDGNRVNNTQSNLRAATRQENARNVALRKTNKTGFRGVYWEHATKMWRAGVSLQGKQVRRRFQDIADAIAWRKEQEVVVYGAFSPAVCRNQAEGGSNAS